jgi:type I restriction enzyme M protein
VAELLASPRTSLDIMAYLSPQVGDFGSPKEIAFDVADRLNEAAAHFRQVAEALPGQ